MGGKSSGSGGGGKKRRHGGGGGWSGEDHAAHTEEQRRKRMKKQQKKEQQQQQESSSSSSKPAQQQKEAKREREQVLTTRGSAGRKEELRLRLHLSKTQRELHSLKERLEQWDPQQEAAAAAADEEIKAVAESLVDDDDSNKNNNNTESCFNKNNNNKTRTTKKRKRGRLGPETWKLKGAAKPAWQVYEFDTRYVDPHIEAHRQAKDKAQRCQNLLALYKGRFGKLLQFEEEEEENNNDADKNNNLSRRRRAEVCREYLQVLMQYGHLSLEAQHFASARTAWLECLELEGGDHDDDDANVKNETHESTSSSTTTITTATTTTTTAREWLMRLYLQQNKYILALRLGSIRLARDSSVWIRYSTAWAALIVQQQHKQQHKQENRCTKGNINNNINKKNMNEDKDSDKNQANEDNTEHHLVLAIKSNIFCAYYLAFYDVFVHVMEYTNDIAEAHADNDEPQSSLEEAIEYCCSPTIETSSESSSLPPPPQAMRWKGMPQQRLQTILVQALHGQHPQLSTQDVAWEDRLSSIIVEQSEHASQVRARSTTDHSTALTKQDDDDDSTNDDGGGGDDDDDPPEETEGPNQVIMIDVAMYAGMFRTAMEMVEDDGLLILPSSASS